MHERGEIEFQLVAIILIILLALLIFAILGKQVLQVFFT